MAGTRGTARDGGRQGGRQGGHDGGVDTAEVARFDRLSARWWDEAGPMRVLHRFNPVRVGYVRDAVAARHGRESGAPRPLDGLSVLDVGCGGGVLCEPLARLGARVTGLDPATGNLAVARAHAEASGLAIDYRPETIEVVAAGPDRFDVVLAMEVVEHVPDPRAFLAACGAAVAPGGLLFAATINRTWRAHALAIVAAEYVLGWLPRGTHDWERFVTPKELTAAIDATGLAVTDTTGVVYDPLRDLWRTSRDTAVNYMVTAVRD